MKFRTVLSVIFLITVLILTSCESDTADTNPLDSLPVIDFTEDSDEVTIFSDDDIDSFISDIDSYSPASSDNEDFSADSGLSDSSGIISIIGDISDSFTSSSEISASENNDFSDLLGAEDVVWIPASGKKYHKTSDCSNMKSPQKASLQKAKELGYEPCKRCYK